MAQVYVVHGYTASPEKWLDHLMVQVDLSQPTIFVGHSLGCVAILNYLATVQKAIIGAIFVSGFSQPLSTLPELDDFAKYYAKLPAYSLKSYVVSAIDDRIVPHHYSDHLAQHLNADYIRLNQGGHFLDREGITTFPLVLELINKLGDQATQ